MTPNQSKEGLPFEPSVTPLDDDGTTPQCQEPTATIRLRRVDNTGHPLAPQDSGRMAHRTRAHSATPETGEQPDVALYTELPPGDHEWRWRPQPAGAHLIALEAGPEKRDYRPGEALAEAPVINAPPEGRDVTATHLPPPVLISLRDEDIDSDRLTSEQLAYFQRNGNNALLFIHGYNVGHGEWGKVLEGVADHWNGKAPKWTDEPLTVYRDADTINDEHGLDLAETDLNNEGAHNWAVSMEYQLNRAAGFSDDDWMPYSRIITVSWPGDTGQTDFMQSEFNANAAGRRLVRLLEQLADAGVGINIITHSLGARVGLTALNILGAIRSQAAIDHLFLWEPAVADNALTNDTARDVHPLGMGVFVNAHKAARRIVVLHSRGDGVLGPTDDEEEQSMWEELISVTPAGWIADAAESVMTGRFMDDLLGTFGGVYTKKWWTFPSFLDNGLGAPLERLYADYMPLQPGRMVTRRGQSWREGPDPETVNANWERLKADIIAEARNRFDACKDCLQNSKPLPRYDLLSPLNHLPIVTKARAEQYADDLRALAERNWYPRQAPRPALGYDGVDALIGQKAGENRDQFLERQFKGDYLSMFDQSDWLFSHSGMRIPNSEIFERSYRDGVMRRIQVEGTGFGSYT
ncbi:alpha/beta hydrolase family protein DUF900 [Tamilnaduibacter salinus]|uniref:Alpha/beta hydrolase family protein DUF900 n=1 Tax=Tamilnaduibacter salinus TaxID=1484056 RepID=A0A2U1CYU3_9GAMM|nr:alpha/beta hydrolase [Tamilnaduibacter salinus]PVY77587.1 alpha/beta hydrolase family protein DUF900 [Tamilnaduibacter salinus]